MEGGVVVGEKLSSVGLQPRILRPVSLHAGILDLTVPGSIDVRDCKKHPVAVEALQQITNRCDEPE